MSYADLAAVKARAGRLSPAWGPATTPSDADIQGFLSDVAGEIDALIAARGFAVPVTGAAANALRGLNADGALVLACDATFPDEEGPGSAGSIEKDARKRYEDGMTALAEGKHPAVQLLESSSSAPSASSFWDDEPDYGLGLTQEERVGMNPYLAPTVERGQTF